VNEFYQKRLIRWDEGEDGTVIITISKNGRREALKYNIDEIKLPNPKAWDNIWRVVFFDIPERKRQARDALRSKLIELGFSEFQKSVFIYPFACEKEIDFIVEFFHVRAHVRYAEVTNLTNQEEIMLRFGLK